MNKDIGLKSGISVLFALALVSNLSGCATARTLDAAKPGAPVIYAGTRLNLYALSGKCCAEETFGAQAPGNPALDLPASALLDTLLLPLSLATNAGVGMNISGDLSHVRQTIQPSPDRYTPSALAP